MNEQTAQGPENAPNQQPSTTTSGDVNRQAGAAADRWTPALNRSLKLVGILVGLTLAAFLSALIYFAASADSGPSVAPGIGDQGLTCADGSTPVDGFCADGSIPG
jgi:hypothetical protein